MSDIGIVGAGSFGTALAISLASENKNVTLWARSQSQVEEMIKFNENKKFLLSGNLKLISSIIFLQNFINEYFEGLKKPFAP